MQQSHGFFFFLRLFFSYVSNPVKLTEHLTCIIHLKQVISCLLNDLFYEIIVAGVLFFNYFRCDIYLNIFLIIIIYILVYSNYFIIIVGKKQFGLLTFLSFLLKKNWFHIFAYK